MIYIGDLSKADAQIIKKYIAPCENILEFGCGASTQIMSQVIKPEAQIISVDTSMRWIQITEKNFKDLQLSTNNIRFITFNKYPAIIKNKEFDVIFNDGRIQFRLEFALNTWDNLRVGGYYIFHDTRRPEDIKNVFQLVEDKFCEIDMIKLNVCASNMTIIHKCSKIKYENWNKTENKEPWMINERQKRPDNWIEILRKNLNE